jgi:hypothetical protein
MDFFDKGDHGFMLVQSVPRASNLTARSKYGRYTTSLNVQHTGFPGVVGPKQPILTTIRKDTSREQRPRNSPHNGFDSRFDDRLDASYGATLDLANPHDQKLLLPKPPGGSNGVEFPQASSNDKLQNHREVVARGFGESLWHLLAKVGLSSRKLVDLC